MASGETLPDTPASTTIANYVIERELGRGGMGAVYVGIHPLIGKRVAIKVLLPALSQQKALVDRFFTEAKAASHVKHPGIVEVNDYGVGPDGNAYIIMEYLEGESLASRLRSQGRLAVATAIGIARQTALALAAAHRVGIVHRDLKPDNIFLVPDAEVLGGERVKLLDFGVAKLIDQQAPGTAQTVTGAILGTPQYMSPEQCEGSRVIDHRSDLYSLGCTLFQMLTGRLPFIDSGIGGLIGAHLHMAPPRVRSVDPSVPDGLDAIVDRLLAKSPDARFASGDEVATALSDPALGGSTRPQPIPAVSISGIQHPTPPPLTPTSTELPRKRRWLPVVAVIGLLGAGAAAFAIVKSQSTDEPTKAAPTQELVKLPATVDPSKVDPKIAPTDPPKASNDEVAKSHLVTLRTVVEKKDLAAASSILASIHDATQDAAIRSEAATIAAPLKTQGVQRGVASVKKQRDAGHCDRAKAEATQLGEMWGDDPAFEKAATPCTAKVAAGSAATGSAATGSAATGSAATGSAAGSAAPKPVVVDESANVIKAAWQGHEYAKAAVACKARAAADRADLFAPCIESACRVGRFPLAKKWFDAATTDAQRQAANTAASSFCPKALDNVRQPIRRPNRR